MDHPNHAPQGAFDHEAEYQRLLTANGGKSPKPTTDRSVLTPDQIRLRGLHVDRQAWLASQPADSSAHQVIARETQQPVELGSTSGASPPFAVQTFSSSLTKGYDTGTDREAFERGLINPKVYGSKEPVDAEGNRIIPGQQPRKEVASWGCPLFSPGLRKSGQRAGEVPSLYWYVVVEHDGEMVSFDDAVAAIKVHGVDAILYTSASHTPEHPRWRVVAPLQAPCSVDEYLDHADKLNGVLGGVCASECNDMTRQWFFGKVKDTAKHFRSARTGGAPLDTLTGLPSTALPRKAKRAPRERGNAPIPVSLKRLESALAFLAPDDYEYYVPGTFSWLTAVNACKYEAVQAGDLPAGAEILHAWSSRYTQRNGYNPVETDLQYDYSNAEHANPTTGASIIAEVHRVEKETGRAWEDPDRLPTADGFENLDVFSAQEAAAVRSQLFNAFTVLGHNDADVATFTRLSKVDQDEVVAMVEIVVDDKAAAEMRALLERVRSGAAKAARFTLVRADEFATRPAGRWRVKGVLPESGLAMVYGAPGSGKSFFALDICGAIVAGEQWRGLRVKQGRVVYIAAEGAAGFAGRLKAYIRHRKPGPEFGDRFTVIGETPNFWGGNGDAAEIVALVKADGGADVIVIDTLASSSAGADENTGKDMNLIMGRLLALQKATGALVVLVHHSGKDETRGARGWSGMKAAMDAEIEVSRPDEESLGRVARVTKLKEGEQGAQYGFSLVSVELGHDEDGDPITSCIVEPSEEIPTKRSRQKAAEDRRPSGQYQQTGYDHVVAAGGPVPLKDVIGVIAAKMPAPEEGDRDRRRSNAQRDIDRLIKGDFLEKVDGECLIVRGMGNVL